MGSCSLHSSAPLMRQAEGKFRIGIMDFPTPTRHDPTYGNVSEGPRYENVSQGFALGITTRCKYPEVAQDFLLFMAAKTSNEKLNQRVGWIPAIRGAAVNSMLQKFEPNLEGVYPQFDNGNLAIGGETLIKWQQVYSLYQVGQLSYDELINQFQPFYKVRGQRDYENAQREARRNIGRWETILTTQRAKALMASDPDEAKASWIRYRYVLKHKQLGTELSLERSAELVGLKPDPTALAPYEYSPSVLQKIWSRARETTTSSVGNEEIIPSGHDAKKD